MDYIRLIDITNKYPNLPSYVRKNETSGVLLGLYKEVNQLQFKLPTIDFIKPIDDLNLRMIIGVRKNAEDKNIKWFTSQQFYSDMEAANVEANPYFLTQALNIEFLLLVDFDLFLTKFQSLKEIEEKQGILMKFNNFILEDSTIDYKKLIQFLDWVMTEPKLDEIDTDGVIPADKLGIWEVGDYDPIMMKWTYNKTKNNEAGNTIPNNPAPNNTQTPVIGNWKLRRKRNLDRNGMSIHATPDITLDKLGRVKEKRTGLIKEGQSFKGYVFKKIGPFTLWALQSDPNGTPTGYAFQGKGDTVDPA